MKKKLIIIFSSIAVVGIAILITLLFIKPQEKTIKAIDAIPGSPALIIETNNFQNFYLNLTEENFIYQEVKKILKINSSNSIIHCLDSLTNFSLLSELKTNKIIFTLDKQIDDLSQTIYIELDEQIKSHSFSTKLKNDLKQYGELRERDYKGVSITNYQLKNSSKLFFSVCNHLLILSNSAVLVEKSIEQAQGNNSIVKRDKSFEQVYESAGKNELANVYINPKQFESIFTHNFSENVADNLVNFRNYADWIELDLNLDTEKILFNGFVQNVDSLASFSQIFYSQQVCSMNCREIIPDNSCYYTILAFNNKENYSEKLNSYLKQVGNIEKREEKINFIKDTYKIDLNSFYNLIENEVCLSATINDKNSSVNFYTILSLKSHTSGVLELENILKSSKIEAELKTLKTDIKIDENINIECYKFPFSNLPELLFGPIFENASSNYVCFVKNYMVFAESKEALINFANTAMLNRTMSTNIEHNKFLDNFSSNSLLFTYFSFLEGYSLIGNYFNTELEKLVKDNIKSIQKLGYIAYQLNIAGERLYNNLVLQYGSEISEKPQTLWESRLDNPVKSKPYLVINHNDNNKEILVQDENNILYLLNNNGREIWKINIDESIIGKIYQIDLHKNNKLQYLFLTTSKIHLIDRLGNYVNKYPINLRSNATAPLSVFDYENNKNYRILIPCEDKKVYLYDADGNIVKGWEFTNTENLVKNEACYFKIGKEEYIIFHDDYRLYAISRKGGTKITFLSKFKFSESNKIYLDVQKASTRFVTSDDNGIIRYFSTNGNQDSLYIKDFGKNHYFLVEDLDYDGNSDYLFADSNKLEAYNCNKKLLFSLNFEDKILFEPNIYKFASNQIKIGVVCKEKIYLLNEDGSYFEDFPLKGRTPFSIGYLNNIANKFNLIVGGPENLLYNYNINENQ